MDISLEDRSAQESEAGRGLNGDDDENDEDSELVSVKVCETMHLGGADIAAVDQIEELEEDESVPDQRVGRHFLR